MTWTLYQKDYLELLRSLPDHSVNLAVWDPPYYKYVNRSWDKQWATEGEYFDFIEAALVELCRVLTHNGSNYMFCSDSMATPLEMLTRQHLNVLNRIVWAKSSTVGGNNGQWNRQDKDTLRRFFPQTEYLIFSEQHNTDSMALGESGYAAQCEQLRGFVFEPLRAYFASEKERAGVSNTQIMDWFEVRGLPRFMTARHTFTTTQWRLPTEKNYLALRQCFNELGNHSRDYLRTEYEELRRPFYVSDNVQFTDVWNFQTIPAYNGKHPCEKPVALYQHIINASTQPGDVVLDMFMGSGNSGVAAVAVGRDYIGGDLQERWVNVARRKLSRVDTEYTARVEFTAREAALPLFSTERS